jgi:hypothetical protein
MEITADMIINRYISQSESGLCFLLRVYRKITYKEADRQFKSFNPSLIIHAIGTQKQT